ncbi:MAG: UDP-3-O-acyl-N-acetylglucosamine deacetylase [Deltaproteobacteria bacterium]|nr:UDP-3-O-acyl-N-acetylglucosamine deacetylase [Deltaproteobacteria bacterium]
MFQTTIKSPFLINGGIGLHSGQKTNLAFHPAPANHGIVFHRTDKDVFLPANYRFVRPSTLCTLLIKDDVEIQTIEHLLSVCNGMGIDNLLIEIKSEEVPIFDGSGFIFYEKFNQVGVKELEQPKKAIKITDTVYYEKNDIVIYATEANQSNFTFSIDFEHKQIGAQEFSFLLNERNYIEQIVRAKTFCMEKDIPKLKEMGLIKGGSKENAIILADDGHFENIEVMTWLNEPNLHKILDQVGDFFLADNMRIIGNIYSHKSGHATHFEFIRYLMEECSDKYKIVNLV